MKSDQAQNNERIIYILDPNVLAATLTGHTDAVWSLSYLGGNHQQLLSASADGTVKLWSPISKSTSNNVGPQQLVKTFGYSPTPGMIDTWYMFDIHWFNLISKR